jgi:hypothetical protein
MNLIFVSNNKLQLIQDDDVNITKKNISSFVTNVLYYINTKMFKVKNCF